MNPTRPKQRLTPTSPAIGSPEQELLLLCIRSLSDTQCLEHINTLLDQNLDWEQFKRLADCHKVTSIVFHSLQASGVNVIPPHVFKQLEFQYHSTSLRNQFLAEELIKILEIFAQHKVLAIPYKGIDLVQKSYPNIALRHFNDIDILIAEKDKNTAKTLLCSIKYQPFKDTLWEQHFIHCDHQIVIDLHSSVIPSFISKYLSFEYLWTCTRSISISGKQVSVLPLEELLQILCILIGKDIYQRKLCLVQLCDLSQIIITHPQIDWRSVIKQSQVIGCERIVLLALVLMNQLIGTQLPPAISDRLQYHPFPPQLVEESISRLFCQDDVSLGAPRYGFWYPLFSSNHLTFLSMRERVRDKFIYCLYWLKNLVDIIFKPTQKERDMLDLPSFLSFLFYPLRLLRLVAKYANPLKSTNRSM